MYEYWSTNLGAIYAKVYGREVRLKSSLLYPALSLRVPQKYQLTTKVRRCSRDDKPVFIEEIQAGNQKVRSKYLKP